MSREQMEADLVRISNTLDVLRAAWPLVSKELQTRLDRHVNNLISNNNEQTRGAIKELRQLLELPQALSDERESLAAALSSMDAANN